MTQPESCQLVTIEVMPHEPASAQHIFRPRLTIELAPKLGSPDPVIRRIAVTHLGP